MSEAVALDSGEHAIWSGRPNALWLAIRRAWQPLLLAIMFLGMCITYLSGDFSPAATRTDSTLLSTMVFAQTAFTAVAGILSLLFFAGAPWSGLRAFRTSYCLTNRRIIIDVIGPFQRRLSMPLEHLRFNELRGGFLGPSDIIFNETMRFSLDGWGVRGEGFIAIPEAIRVERLVRDAIEQTFATRSRSPWQ